MRRLLLGWCFLAALAAGGCSSCVDPKTVEKPFPCHPEEYDGGECPKNWRCGLAGRCFNPDAGVAYACTDTALHCAEGWRCGYHAEGEAGLCQAVGVGGPFPCSVATQAEDCGDPAWRCDPVTSTCVEITEVLQATTFTQARVEQLSPRLDTGLPGHVAVGRMQSAPHPATGEPIGFRPIAFTSDAGLVSVLVTSEEQRLPDGGSTRVFLRTFPLDAEQVSGLATFDVTVVAVLDGGALRLYDSFTGQVSTPWRDAVRVVPLDPGRENVSVQSDGGAVAFGRDWVRIIKPSADGGTEPQWVAVWPQGGFDASFPGVLDVSGSDERVLVAAGDRLYDFSPRFANEINAVVLAPEIGAVDVRPHGPIRRLHALPTGPIDPVFLVVELALADGGVGWAQLDQRGTCNSRPCYQLTSGPCPVCPSGAAPLQVSVTRDDPKLSGGTIVARCPSVGPGAPPLQRTWRVSLGDEGSCDPSSGGGGQRTVFASLDEDETPFALGLSPMRATGTFRAHGGPQGRVWWAEDTLGNANPAGPLHPLVLDRVPDVVVRFFAQGGGRSVAQTVASAGGTTFVPSELGFVSAPSESRGKLTVLGSVQLRPGVLIGADQVINVNAFSPENGEPQVLARLDATAPPITGPASGAIVEYGTPKRRLLVVASRDVLYGADVTNQLKTLGSDGVDGRYFLPAPLTQRLVPAPGVPIRDLAVGRRLNADGGPDAPDGTFFVLARSEVFEVDVYADGRWLVTPVPLVAELGEPLELWTESIDHGRLAYASGQISALPVPLPLGQPLPEGGRVTDFARMCGATFALVDGGVKHYRTDAGWFDVPGVALDAQERVGARFYETANALFLGTGTGRVLELYVARDGGVPVCTP